ncbi:MAG TPA: hypothetical protein VN660_03255 [Steroidobacteraceae bacterium]|nr:hypothetical protein [Steroidobacteraceae bacterium]
MLQITHIIDNSYSGEDRLLIERRGGSRTILAVCDGAGNGGRGGMAADMAIAGLAGITGFLDCQRTLLALDQKIHHEAQGGETTCVLIEISDKGELRGASVGDSSAWMIPARGLPTELTGAQDRARLGSGRCAPRLFKTQLRGHLLIATDGLRIPMVDLPHYSRRGIDALLERARLKSGTLTDDVAAILAA